MKLKTFNLSILIIWVLIILFGGIRLVENRNEYKIINTNLQSIIELNTLINDLQILTNEMVIYQLEDTEKNWIEKQKRIEISLQRISQKTNSTTKNKFVKDLTLVNNNLLKIYKEFIKIKDIISDDYLKVKTSQLFSNTSQMTKLTQNLSKNQNLRLNSLFDQILFEIIIFFIFLVTFLVFNFIYSWKNILGPILKISNKIKYSKNLIEVDNLNVSSNNEIGELNNTLNKYVYMINEQKTLFENTFEQAAVGIAQVSPDGKWIKVNQKLCDIIGYSKDELYKLTFQDITHKEDLETDLEFVMQMLDKKLDTYSMKKRYLRKDKSIVWINLTVALVWKKDNTPDFFISVIQDISVQKNYEKELLDTNNELIEKGKEINFINKNLESLVDKKTDENFNQFQVLQQQSKLAAMGEMIGAIAHQWRQPLNVLALDVQILVRNSKKEDFSPEYIEKYKEKSISTISFMSQTIDDFRNFFKVDKEKQKFDVKDAILEIVNIQNAQLKSHRITLEIKGEGFIVNNLKSEFIQVVMNLINNSKDAIVSNNIEDGKITILLKDEKIVIKDNGGGINQDILDRIFEPYFTTKHQSQGTGLGLYLSKMIIEDNMNGKITVNNISNGVEFEIRLDNNE